jgi:hypothetical protein
VATIASRQRQGAIASRRFSKVLQMATISLTLQAAWSLYVVSFDHHEQVNSLVLLIDDHRLQTTHILLTVPVSDRDGEVLRLSCARVLSGQLYWRVV